MSVSLAFDYDKLREDIEEKIDKSTLESQYVCKIEPRSNSTPEFYRGRTEKSDQSRIIDEDSSSSYEFDNSFTIDFFKIDTVPIYRNGSITVHKANRTFTVNKHKSIERITKTFAVKIFSLCDSKRSKRIENELYFMTTLNHSKIIKCIHYQNDDICSYIFMPYYDINLEKYILQMPETISSKLALKFFKQISRGVKYLHQNNIAHCDIKAENVMVDLNGLKLKLCDFEFAKICKKNEKIVDKCGTPLYSSPELFYKEKFDPFKSDIWSMGVLFYFVLHKLFPFDNEENDIQRLAISIGKEQPPFSFYDKECTDLVIFFDRLVNTMLEKTPENRLDIYEVCKLLKL